MTTKNNVCISSLSHCSYADFQTPWIYIAIEAPVFYKVRPKW